MKSKPIWISSLAVAFLNLASIVIGFAIYFLSGVDSQLMVEVPTAFVLGIVLVIGWLAGLHRYLGLDPEEDFILVFFFAFPAGAVLFTIVHFIVAGYLTSAGNIVGIFALQGGENMVALPVAAALVRRRATRKSATAN